MSREDKRSYVCIFIILVFLALMTVQTMHTDYPTKADHQLSLRDLSSGPHRQVSLDYRRIEPRMLIAKSEKDF